MNKLDNHKVETYKHKCVEVYMKHVIVSMSKMLKKLRAVAMGW